VDWDTRTDDRRDSNDLVDLVSESSTRPTQRGPSRMKSGENVMMKFVCGIDGTEVSAARAAEIRKGAYEIWQYLYTKGKLPETWGQADMETALFYRNDMRARFPEVGLCDANWKVDKIATDIYPQWYRRHIMKKISVKRESVDMATNSESALDVPSKRRDTLLEQNSPAVLPQQKKQKNTPSQRGNISKSYTSTLPSTTESPRVGPAPGEGLDKDITFTTTALPVTAPASTILPSESPVTSVSQSLSGLHAALSKLATPNPLTSNGAAAVTIVTSAAQPGAVAPTATVAIAPAAVLQSEAAAAANLTTRPAASVDTATIILNPSIAAATNPTYTLSESTNSTSDSAAVVVTTAVATATNSKSAVTAIPAPALTIIQAAATTPAVISSTSLPSGPATQSSSNNLAAVPGPDASGDFQVGSYVLIVVITAVLTQIYSWQLLNPL
jgi:hypothetical protein